MEILMNLGNALLLGVAVGIVVIVTDVIVRTYNFLRNKYIK